MQCPRCEGQNDHYAKFCEDCGARLETVCPSCGQPVGTGRKFCGACGASLVADSGRFTSPQNYTPKHITEKILTSKSGLQGERKQVTVLFADMKGSMELLADRDPEEARGILDPVLERMMEAVHRYEGTVNQVMGDGIMALFGAPLAHEDHAVRACYAALRLQESVKRYADDVHRTSGVPIHIRVGLNSGEVVVRSISTDLHMDYTAIGQTTHLASRMEQMAMPGSILVAPATLRLAEGYVVAQPLGLRPVKGLAEPLAVYELTGATTVRSRFHAAASRGLTRFVGREPELEHLRQSLDRASRGHGHVVAVVGDPGVGKSRLCWEFTYTDQMHGWRILESGSVSYERAASYLPVINLLRAYFQVEANQDPRQVRERVIHKIVSLDRQLEPSLPAFFGLLDLPIDDASWNRLDPPQRRQATLEAVARLLLREASVQPLVVIFEDLHWIDAETQAFLDRLVESLEGARILLLVNYRPEYRHPWGGLGHEIRIDSLPPRSADELLDVLLGSDSSLTALKRLLIARTDSNPLFLEESVRSLAETGTLVGERGDYRLEQRVPTLLLPVTTQAMLGARIDRLAPRDKHLLQAAAVIGKSVPFELLQLIAEESEDSLRLGLMRLENAEFLLETRLFPDLEYTFKHALTHEVAYASLLQDRRRQLHASIVRAIETIGPARLHEHLDALARHALRGELWDKAVYYLRQAATRAAARSAHHEALDLIEQALAALHHLPSTPDTLREAIDLHFAARNSLWPLTDHPRIFEHLKEAEALAEKLHDQHRLGQVASFMAQHHRVIGEPDRAVESAERALRIARALGNQALEIDTNFRLGLAYLNLGDYRRASDVLARNVSALEGARLHERSGQPGLPAVLSRAWRALCLAELGEFAEGLTLGREALRIAVEADHPYSIISAHVGLGGVQLARGDLDDALATLERGLTLCRRYDIPVQFRLIASELGCAYARAGRTAEAIPLLEQTASEEGARATMASRSLLIVRLAEAYLLAERRGEAMPLAARALGLARERKERGYEAWGLRLEAAIAASGPRPETAPAPYRATMQLAAELQMRPLLAITHFEYGILCQQLGTMDCARSQLSAAALLFRFMEMRHWLERAEAILAGIS